MVSRLNFTPIIPTRLDPTHYTVQGARYCTIGDAIAIQVRIQGEDVQPQTLYQFRTTEQVLLPEETVIQIDDVQVTLWQEGDLVLGLAEITNP